MSLQTPVHRPDEGLDQSDQLVRSDRAPGPSQASPSARGRNGVDRYGLVALLVAAGGLAAVLVLQAHSAGEGPAPDAHAPGQSTQLPAVAAAPPVRDQWYLDNAQSAPAAQEPAVGPDARAEEARRRALFRWEFDAIGARDGLPPVRDQWYLDQSSQAPTAADLSAATSTTTAAQIGAIPARDQWYLDHVQVAAAPPLWSQARDRWYLDGRVATDVPKDRWYSDRP